MMDCCALLRPRGRAVTSSNGTARAFRLTQSMADKRCISRYMYRVRLSNTDTRTCRDDMGIAAPVVLAYSTWSYSRPTSAPAARMTWFAEDKHLRRHMISAPGHAFLAENRSQEAPSCANALVIAHDLASPDALDSVDTVCSPAASARPYRHPNKQRALPK